MCIDVLALDLPERRKNHTPNADRVLRNDSRLRPQSREGIELMQESTKKKYLIIPLQKYKKKKGAKNTNQHTKTGTRLFLKKIKGIRHRNQRSGNYEVSEDRCAKQAPQRI